MGIKNHKKYRNKITISIYSTNGKDYYLRICRIDTKDFLHGIALSPVFDGINPSINKEEADNYRNLVADYLGFIPLKRQ